MHKASLLLIRGPPGFLGHSLRRFLLKNLARDENGRLRWKIHLEAIDRNYDKRLRGLSPQRSFNKPALFIRGGQSNYIEDDDATLIRQMFPQAEIAICPKPVTGFTSTHQKNFSKRL